MKIWSSRPVGWLAMVEPSSKLIVLIHANTKGGHYAKPEPVRLYHSQIQWPAGESCTESLHYILRQHSARNAFLQFIGQLAPGLNPVTRLETQTGTDKSARPDMLGRDIDGKPVLAIEAKFWAGLTDRQPIDYIEKVLPKDRRALLLFIAPERRFETLWPELIRRCRQAGLEIATEAQGESIWKIARLTSERTLALTSWAAAAGSFAGG